jgi:hypothetical protein
MPAAGRLGDDDERAAPEAGLGDDLRLDFKHGEYPR